MPLDTKNSTAIRRTGTWLMWSFGTLLVATWLAVGAPTVGQQYPLALSADQQLVLVALLAGALGGSIHVATSFADYVGNGRYDSRWLWWYMLRPLIGSALAFVFLCVVKAGWLPLDASVWSIAAMSAMVGLFSKQAVDKLADVLDTLLKTDKDATRAGSLQAVPAVPVLTGVVPDSAQAGSGAQKVVVTGTGLPAKAHVRYAAADRPAAYVDEARTRLEVSLTADDVAAAGTFPISVRDAAQDDGPAASIDFKVLAKPQLNVGADTQIVSDHGRPGAPAPVPDAEGGEEGGEAGENRQDSPGSRGGPVPDADEGGGGEPGEDHAPRPPGGAEAGVPAATGGPAPRAPAAPTPPGPEAVG